MKPKVILHFWFEETSPQQWFVKDEAFDQLIRDRFSDIYTQAASGQLDAWVKEPEGALALVIILDQFSRNMFRGSEKSFATDNKALEIAKNAAQAGLDKKLDSDIQRIFLYMPFMHSESLQDQAEGIRLFKHVNNPTTLDYAVQHRDIIARFGRFPHRNQVLNRPSTLEEIEFLKQPGSSF